MDIDGYVEGIDGWEVADGETALTMAIWNFMPDVGQERS